MVDPIITPIVISVVTKIVTSEHFIEFGLSLLKGLGKGIGQKSGEGLVKALTGGSNSSKSSDSGENYAYQAAMQKYLQAKQGYYDQDINLRERELGVKQDYYNQDINLREREFAVREEFSQNLLHLLGESQQQKNETKLREIQTNWGKDTWFSKLDRHETELILGQAEHRLLILASPPDISSDCPDTFENNLNKEIKNSLGRFLSQYYPVNSPIHPVQFYGDYFKEPISSIDVKRLQSLLEGLSTVILYSDITDYEVNFNLDCLGVGQTHQYPLPAWNWEDSYKALKQEGKSEKEALRAIRKMIVDVYLLLSAFISDWYYLQINLLYEPQLSQASVKLPDEWVTPCLEQLNQLYRQNQAEVAYQESLLLLDNKEYEKALPLLQQAVAEKPEIQTIFDYVKGLCLLKQGQYPEALQCFESVLQKQSDFAEVWFNQGVALQKLNRIGEAKTAFKQALELEPELSNQSTPELAYLLYPSFTEILSNKVELEMVSIPTGEFMMGNNKYGDDKPIHKVALKGFYMGKYPITQAQYQAVMGVNPSRFKGDNHPVEQVSWNDAQEFCRKLSEMTGKIYQLPSEAQWEYSCRAGSTTRYYFGDDEGQLGNYAWYRANSNRQTHPVGQKKPNNWGLYDMHGNVWEWCEDDYIGNYENTPTDGTAYKNESMQYIVLRGGSWSFNPQNCCSVFRFFNTRSLDFNNIGFRVVYVVGDG
ncbi:MAG: SUMF1/EgtB/PvdO family nonheme iron enzyme [Microcystaceae cyanobacterium]